MLAEIPLQARADAVGRVKDNQIVFGTNAGHQFLNQRAIPQLGRRLVGFENIAHKARAAQAGQKNDRRYDSLPPVPSRGGQSLNRKGQAVPHEQANGWSEVLIHPRCLHKGICV